MNPYFSHQQRHIQSNLSTRISNNIAQGSFENMHLNRMKYSNNLSPKGIHFTSINDNMIVQLRDEIRKVTSEKNKLLQENIMLKNDFNKIMSNRDSTQYKKKSMPNETIIKSLQDQIQILNDELKHKELIIENYKKFENEFSKVKDKILKTPTNINVDATKELVFAKGEIMRLQNEKNKYMQEVNNYKKRVDEYIKLNEQLTKKITENNSEIKNKENVIKLLSDKNVQQKELIQNLTNTNDILKIRIQNIVEELEEARKSIDNLTHENKTLTQQIIHNKTFKSNKLYFINIDSFNIIDVKKQKINYIQQTTLEIISNLNNNKRSLKNKNYLICNEYSLSYNKVISNKNKKNTNSNKPNTNTSSLSKKIHTFTKVIPQNLTTFSVHHTLKSKNIFTILSTVKQQCSLLIKGKETLIKKEKSLTKTPPKTKTQNTKQQQVSLIKIKKDISFMIKTNKPKKVLLIDSYKGFTYNQKPKQVLNKKILKNKQLLPEKTFTYSYSPITKQNKIFKSKTNPKFKTINSKRAVNLQIKSNCFELISIPKKTVVKKKKPTLSIYKESFNMLLTKKKFKLALNNFSHCYLLKKREALPFKFENNNFNILCFTNNVKSSLDNNWNNNLLVTQEYLITYNKDHNTNNKKLNFTINQIQIELLNMKRNVLQYKNININCTSFFILSKIDNKNKINNKQFNVESFNVTICSQKQIIKSIINEEKSKNSKTHPQLTLNSFHINYYTLPKNIILSLNSHSFCILQNKSLSNNSLSLKDPLTSNKILSLSKETNFSYNKTKQHFSNLSNELPISINYLISNQTIQKDCLQLSFNHFFLSFTSDNQSKSLSQTKKDHKSFNIINTESLYFIVPLAPKSSTLNSREHKEETIKPFSPSNYDIISEKEEGDLHWYLMISKDNQSKQKLNYDTCLWIPETQITYPISFYTKYTFQTEIKKEPNNNDNNKPLKQKNSFHNLEINKNIFLNFEITKQHSSYINTSLEKKQEEKYDNISFNSNREENLISLENYQKLLEIIHNQEETIKKLQTKFKLFQKEHTKKQDEKFDNIPLNANKEENLISLENYKKLLGIIHNQEEIIKKFQTKFKPLQTKYKQLQTEYEILQKERDKLQEESKLKDVSFNIKDINNNSFFNEESFIHEMTETNSLGDPSTEMQLKNLLSLFISIINLHPEKDEQALKIYKSICSRVGMNESEIKEMMDIKKKASNKKKKMFGIFGKKDKKDIMNKSSKSNNKSQKDNK